jgi:hypothetical protein
MTSGLYKSMMGMAGDLVVGKRLQESWQIRVLEQGAERFSKPMSAAMRSNRPQALNTATTSSSR